MCSSGMSSMSFGPEHRLFFSAANPSLELTPRGVEGMVGVDQRRRSARSR